MRYLNSAALVVLTVVAFLTAHHMGQLAREGHWIEAGLNAALLGVFTVIWFKLRGRVRDGNGNHL
jgi:uncharacterized membrane protein YphA (DoxX/SURF4 family)